MRRRIGVLIAVAAFVLAADAITKAIVVAHLREDQPVHLIGNVLMFWLTRNPGAAFSVGTGETVVFTVIAFGVIVYIARTARRLYSLGWAIALGLLLLPFSRRMRRKVRSIRLLMLCAALVLSLAAISGLAGCGASSGYFGQPSQSYTINVIGTATGPGGATLQHLTTVTLTVQ